MSTKNEQILDPRSAWNQAPGDEPVCALRACEWREVLFMALRKPVGSEQYKRLFALSQEMKSYSDDEDIPF